MEVLSLPLVGSLFFPTLIIGGLIVILFVIISHAKVLVKCSSQEEDEPTIGGDTKTSEGNNHEQKKTEKKKKGCCGGEGSCKNNVQMIQIFFGTQTGRSKSFAMTLTDEAKGKGLKTRLVDLENYDPEDNLTLEVSGNNMNVFLISTYTDGAPPESAKWFYKWLEEATNDFRVQKALLKGMRYSVFGLGNSLYSHHYNEVAKNVDKWLHKLKATRAFPLGLGDENVASSVNGSLEKDFSCWSGDLWTGMEKWISRQGDKKNKKSCSCKGNGKSEDDEGMGEEISSNSSPTDSDSSSSEAEEESGGIVDLEDLGRVVSSHFSVKKKNSEMAQGTNDPSEMITPSLRETLTRQGYRLVGSHSGVKMCRWTKSMLRGRGGCYKHSFYGIESHRCVELTPSLACANKCVFCWRHHSNPVGTTWTWKMDEAEFILEKALEHHYQMIKQFQGVPGVLKERVVEGMQAKHCALSLVGEPIMYPEINQFLRLLHGKEISSFLVTNAQFPEAIRNLVPVTQLYLSIDASTKDSLKKIDRPLFRDFWDRFLDSLRALSEKGQRTVYRLTLVKAWNVDELENYALLVGIGHPDFIEIKGVTYCGTSKASNLTMENVPWHDEVEEFGRKLVNLLPDYDIASEHEHSNCILIAHKKFMIDGNWWTWIDYEKFHELMKEFETSGGQKTFTALDYAQKTPQWAVFGSTERGFDPKETRWHRKEKKLDGGC